MLPQSRDSERGLRPTGLLVKGAPHRGPRERSGVLEGSGARGSTWALSRLSATPWAAALLPPPRFDVVTDYRDVHPNGYS